MSVWSNIQSRSTGEQKRIEDLPEKNENLWEFSVISKWRTSETILDEIERLKTENEKLQDGIADIRRELDRIKIYDPCQDRIIWDKKSRRPCRLKFY